ncbi:MAG TPA: thioredoxin domain-containing protein [Candidatus Acidoferrales bacterium]|nr:thioredoxin domain-containing protein [Candidatus Acidoferrales bacterium]
MKSKHALAVVTAALFVGATYAHQQSTSAPPKQAPASAASPSASSPLAGIRQKIEAYLRHVYAWGPSFKITFGQLKDAPIPGLYQISMDVAMDNQSDSATFYVSKDGRYLMRGELEDMSSDPLVEIQKRINIGDSPSQGPSNAKVVLVEYADFECPSCRQLDTILRSMLPNFTQVRLVYKDFPLTDIHPWALTAAEAGRCAYNQNPTAFWRLHDLIFDHQDLISPTNVWDKMQDYAAQAGLDSAALRTCMADPGIQAQIQKSMTEGEGLHIANTPTVFVNGRRLIAPDASTLDQFIRYELTSRSGSSPN